MVAYCYLFDVSCLLSCLWLVVVVCDRCPSLFGVVVSCRCVFFVVHRLLLMCVVCCLLVVVCCLQVVVRCALCVVRCSLLMIVCGLKFVVARCRILLFLVIACRCVLGCLRRCFFLVDCCLL